MEPKILVSYTGDRLRSPDPSDPRLTPRESMARLAGAQEFDLADGWARGHRFVTLPARISTPPKDEDGNPGRLGL